MKLNIVPARTGILWVKLGLQTFLKQPLALSGLFFMFMALMSVATLLPFIGSALALALLLAVGSTIGAQVGARLSHVLRGEQLMIVLASLALLVAMKMMVGLVTTPESLLSETTTVRVLTHRQDEEAGRHYPAGNRGRNLLSWSLPRAAPAADGAFQTSGERTRCSYSYR